MSNTPIRIVTPSAKPELQYQEGDLGRIMSESITVLASDPMVFKRAGSLVHVVRADAPPSKKAKVDRPLGVPVIRALPQSMLRVRLDAAIRWVAKPKRGKLWEACFPPQPVVDAIHTAGEWGGVRQLAAVITAPTLKPDGEVLQAPGYDPGTGLLYWRSAAYPDVADVPSHEDAKNAAAAILDVVCDFPFATPAHKSAWLAGVLTLLGRHAVDGPVPLFAVDAPTRGTGKSKLTDAAVLLAFGHKAARTVWTKDEDEIRKRITSLCLEGDPSVLIDNVKTTLSSGSLEAVVTSETWKDRALGGNVTVSVPHRIVWWANGNNLSISGDLARRSLFIRLESTSADPEKRTDFKHKDLLKWVTEHRHVLVAQVLTVLRAFVCAGYPQGKSPPAWGSFEAWCELVPACIRWLGLPCPLAARASEGDDVDDDKIAIGRLCKGLLRLDPDRKGLAAREIVRLLFSRHSDDAPDGHDDLRDAIETSCRTQANGKVSARELGIRVRSLRHRLVDGQCLAGKPDRDGVVLWRVSDGIPKHI